MMRGTVLRASASSCSIISSPRRLSIFQKRLAPSSRFGISHQLIVPILSCPLSLARISLTKQKLSVIRLLTVSLLSSSASSSKSLMSSCLLPALSSSFLGTRLERPSPSSGRRRRGPNPTSHRYLKASVDFRSISVSSDRCCRTTRGVIIVSRSMETEKSGGKIECHSSSQSGGGDQPLSSSVLPPRPTRSKAKGLAISFCPRCGGATEEKIPVGENEMRFVCTRCGAVHYQNPKMVVGCLVEHEEKVLLCRRNIEPSYGLWTLPAGYMEIGESAAEGAARETLEEACADVQVIGLFALLDIPFIGQCRAMSFSVLK